MWGITASWTLTFTVGEAQEEPSLCVLQKCKQRLRVLQGTWLESSGCSTSVHSTMTSLCFPGRRVHRHQLAQERRVCKACAELHNSGGFPDPVERPLGQRQDADKSQEKRKHRTPAKAAFFLGTSFPLTQQTNRQVWKASSCFNIYFIFFLIRENTNKGNGLTFLENP